MSEFTQAMKVLQQLEDLGTKRKAKLDLLEKSKENAVLQAMFKRAYDWEQTFGTRVKFHTIGTAGASRTKPLFGEAARDTKDPWEAFNELLDKLMVRKLTGNAAKEAWALLVTRLSEAEHQWFSRIINRDLKIGIDRPTVEAVWPNLIRPFGVQLAKSMGDVEKFEPTKKEPWLGWPVTVEPKLDGMRVIIEYKHATKTCTGFSREGHMLTNIQELLDPLAAHLAVVHGADCWVDTEALADSMQTDGFNVTMSLVKKEDVPPEERAKLKFYCFDLVHDVAHDPRPFFERRELLKLRLGKKAGGPAHFILTKRSIAQDMDQLRTVYNATLDEGHEGVMVKFDASPYKAKRTSAWLKWKPTNTVDAEIIGFTPGEKDSRHEHRLGAFVVKRADNGKTINVGGGLSDKQRDEFWAQREELMGKILEFKEEARAGAETAANFPRFVRMRPDRSKL